MTIQDSRWVAGVDGCRGGWMAVFVDLDGRQPPRCRVSARFGDIVAGSEAPEIIAVDMPIGLPDRIGPDGRGPERAVRARLGARRSSVFAIPSRRAVYAPDYVTACALAEATSDPPRKISRQAFMLFGKIREIDAVMTPDLGVRVREVHPELAFWRLNGEIAMGTPKKIGGRINQAGLAERRAVLRAHGFTADFLDAAAPRGAGADDLLDACAAALIGVRLAEGAAVPFPASPGTDDHGLTIAIWA